MKKYIVLFLITTTLIKAQYLSLDECIKKTLNNHPDIKTFILKQQQSDESYKATRSAYLPQINFSANYNAIETYVLPSAMLGSVTTKDDDGWNAGVYLKQKIWDFSKTSSKIDASKKDKKISKLSLKDLKALMAYKVKSLYEMMVVQKEAIKVRQKDLQTKQAYYEQAKALVKQGLKTKADENRFLSSVYLAKANLEEAKASFEKAKNTLSLYINEKIDNNVKLDESVLKKNINFSHIQKIILNKNIQLKIYNQNIEKNILLHKSSQASHYGSIDAVASYKHIDTLNRYDSKLAGITINIPLYTGGKTSAEAQKAKILTQITKEQKLSKILALKDEINSLLVDIKKYEKTIEAKKAQLSSAIEAKKVLDGRYKEGIGTYIEVLDATTMVLNANLGLLEAYYLKSMAINKLEYLQGQIYEKNL